MIKCNLAVLLAERNIKISELSKRTGLSRTTLTALNQNRSKGIQFDTFDTLCNFLKIKPNELFVQEPIEYNFEVIEINTSDTPNTYNYYVNILANIQHKSELIDTTFGCTVKLQKELNEIRQIYINPVYPGEFQYLLESIPFTFKASIEQELLDAIKAAIVGKLNLDEKNIEFTLG